MTDEDFDDDHNVEMMMLVRIMLQMNIWRLHVASLSTKRTDRRSENQLTVHRRNSRVSTSSSPIAFRDVVNRQFLSADTSPPCENWEMTDLRWRTTAETMTSFWSDFHSTPLALSFWKWCHCCSSRPLTKVAPPTLAGTTIFRAIIDSDLGSSQGSTADGEP
ncbi:hypothetical protein V8G54_033355 [Vigna mungo]|uniref:Uncharacterized protein n=1 Tax=Vigna mungo TaxID=3915 RepID=A0AAQ3MNA6_VIGMU